ncbi:uncharacterized protein Z520_11721 [Fonsecaea multimorphosa CBS 102226]|uniref:Aminoglycoside phosphotransferase domain-containing protein n=1 Tax=Fonsecaea multimorphosa CBS 102226 TaxID=1442371 RepID=A0A0D2GSU6_9EURO|nr:uncharacterized protein Z520_11721 [Fonsecaea multimorphosa CBS 102226]KIX92545.1 hypothetical protein Z520_11721 [Fonsecaea multimorphosa CBS 102226]
MEKLPGRPIGDMWFDLTEDQRLKIISEVVQAEAKLSRIHLPACGSVYYEHDLPADTSRAVITPTSNIKGLCIGPHTNLRWWEKERDSMEIHRGPHFTPIQLLSCIAAKESAWLAAFGRPRLPFERAYRECLNYEKSRPEEHIESLDKYVRLAPYLVPREPRFHRPILRHPDLQPHNIFVSENLDIVGIIDWQHCSVLPQFLAAGIPKYFQNCRDEASLSFLPPKLPENLAEMDDEERAEALERFRQRHLHFFYLGFTQRFNEAHFEILDRRTDLLTRKTFSHAGEPWQGNNIPLKADIIYITRIWEEILNENGYSGAAIPLCPVSFTELDVQRTINILLQQEDMDTQLKKIRDAIGISRDGWASNAEYDQVVQLAKLIKMQALASLDSEEEKEMTLKHWPVDDFDEEG